MAAEIEVVDGPNDEGRCLLVLVNSVTVFLSHMQMNKQLGLLMEELILQI